MNIVGDDEYEKPKKTKAVPIKEYYKNDTNILLVIGIMGAIIVASFLLTGTDCPEIPACPSYNLTCPECPSLECPSNNITLTPLIECKYGNETTNITEITKVFIFSSLNITQNTTYYLNESTNNLQTTEINITQLKEQLGETIVIRAE